MMAIISRQECIDAYKAARKMGRKYLSERHADGQSGFLPVLESILHDTCSEFPLGIYEIPRKKIIGTFAGGRQSAFAGNFMPLLDEDTEFSAKWQNLYQSHTSEGIRYPIKVYEYLGHYYVVEGNKRVSVLSYSGAYSISADVTRLFPPHNAHDTDNSVFYEMLGESKQKIISHLWFSRIGSYTQLLSLACCAMYDGDVNCDDVRLEAEAFIEDCFFKFRKSYHEIGLSSLRLTTGDAFLEFLSVYDFPTDISEAQLKQSIKNCIPKFERFNTTLSNSVLNDPSELPRKENLIFSSLRSKRLSISFAFTDASDTWTQQHKAGQYALKRRFPELPVSEIHLSGIDSYDELNGFLENTNPDLLFITDPRLTRLATRTALERRNCTVLHCHPDSRSFYPSYYGKSQEPAFLCGVLAGALTRTGSVGYIMLNSEAGILTADVQSFAQGARTIRPSVRVHYRNSLIGNDDIPYLLAELAKKGCDVVWLPYQPSVPGQRKIFPGVYAHLCGIDPNGIPIKYYASSAYHWEEFYNRLLKEILGGSSQLSNYSIHFRLGLSNGLLNVHSIYPALTEWPRRLLSQYRHLISSGYVSCLDENMVVELME